MKKKKFISLRQQFNDIVTLLGKKDKKIVVIVGDISHGVLKPFREKFPKRYFNIGILEPSMVNVAAGLSITGLNPIVHTIAPFLIERSYEQIKLDFGYQKLNINLVSVGGTFDYSKLGCSHHCYSDVALIKQLKNSQIFIPGSSEEFRIQFLKNYKKSKINYFRLTENPHNLSIDTKKINKNPILFKKGNKITLIALGPKLKETVEASKELEKIKISCQILYVNQITQINYKRLSKLINKTKNFLCVEELSDKGGLYEECLKATKDLQSIRSDQIAIKDFIHNYGEYHEIAKSNGFSSKNIYKLCIKMLSN